MAEAPTIGPRRQQRYPAVAASQDRRSGDTGKGVLWSPSSFAASCGDAPLSIIKQYIENQKTPD
jgi:REP element-mobilizing transposase RayT